MIFKLFITRIMVIGSTQMVSIRVRKEFGLYTSGNIFVDYQLIARKRQFVWSKISLEHTSVNDRAKPFLFIYRI